MPMRVVSPPNDLIRAAVASAVSLCTTGVGAAARAVARLGHMPIRITGRGEPSDAAPLFRSGQTRRSETLTL